MEWGFVGQRYIDCVGRRARAGPRKLYKFGLYFIHDIAFTNSSSLGRSSRTTYYLLLLGSILPIISLATSVRSRSPSEAANLWPRLTCFVSLSGLIAIRHTRARLNRILSNRFHDQYFHSHLFSYLDSSHTYIKRVGDVNSWTSQPAQFPLGYGCPQTTRYLLAGERSVFW